MFYEMIKFVIVLLLMVCQQGKSEFSSKLQLAVYYESKCPDSRRFIAQQLVPALNRLQDYLDLTLIPFGKASSINNGNSGFQCQHGPSECLGNLVQDCALYYMRGRRDIEKAYYVACEMQNLYGTKKNFRCVESAGLPVRAIQHCVSSNDGVELQLMSEHATNLISPKFIPTVTINNEFNQQIQDNAQVDLFGTLCSLLKDAQPCASLYTDQALHNILF